MTLYAFLLFAHSYVRWGVLAAAIGLLARSAHGWRSGSEWAPADERTHRAFLAFVDTQLLLGLWLYVSQSPITQAFFGDPKRAVKVPALRFFSLDHAVMMVVAVALVHVARVRSKRASSPTVRHRVVALGTLVALVVVAATVPWPFMRYGRPLLRGLPHSDVASAGEACPPTFKERCAACHGAGGRGDGPASASLSPRPRNFADPIWSASRTDAELASVIHDGGNAHGFNPAMPAQPDLSPEELTALVACVRSFSHP
jgi:mono/diheme cytochrome c family protein